MRRFFTKAEFWIILLLIVRLFTITQPPLELSHNWRQMTGLMVARNFYEQDADIFHPEIDDTRGKSGIVAMEFPALNYLHYLTASVFGYQDWYGRLLNLMVSTLGLFFFAKILRLLLCPERMTTFATLLLGCSIWFSFSRKMMPDTFSASLAIMSVYLALRFLRDGKAWQLTLYIILSSLAFLSKIPSAIASALLAFLPFGGKCLSRTWNTEISAKRRWAVIAGAVLPIILTCFWYFVWNPHLAVTYGNWYNLGVPFKQGIADVFRHWRASLHNVTFHAFCGYCGFAATIAGIVLGIIQKRRGMLATAALFAAVGILYVFKSAHNFYNQGYYMIPFVPMMAVMGGYALSRVKRQWIGIALVAICCLESIGNQQHDFFTKETERYKLQLEAIVQENVPQDALVAINGHGNPQLIYFSHRKGWLCSDEAICDPGFLNVIAAEGCKYLIIDHTRGLTCPIRLEKAYEDSHFVIYKM